MKYTVKLNQKIYEVEIEKTGAVTSAAGPHTQPATSAPQSTTPFYPQAAPPSSGNGNGNSTGNTSNAASANNTGLLTSTEIESPMPGKILSISASVGQQVRAGQCLMVLEAMKMENEMVAPRDGTVKQILVSQGTMVNTGDVLAVLI